MKSNHEKWTRIVVARGVELLGLMVACVAGIWHTVKSRRLQDELDSYFENEDAQEKDDEI